MKRKTIVTLVVVAVLSLISGGLYTFDYIISKQYKFELVAQSDDVIIADGVSSVRFRVRLSRDNEPVPNHKIYFFASNGSLPTSRLITNEKGLITFTYYPYLYVNDQVTPLEDVTIYLQDESNSYIFMVSATWNFTIPVEKPTDSVVGADWENL
ncbi:MAG: Ig-like domain-containing protein [Bacilli bacterium]